MNGVLHNSLFIIVIHGFYLAGNGGLEYDDFSKARAWVIGLHALKPEEFTIQLATLTHRPVSANPCWSPYETGRS